MSAYEIYFEVYADKVWHPHSINCATIAAAQTLWDVLSKSGNSDFVRLVCKRP